MKKLIVYLLSFMFAVSLVCAIPATWYGYVVLDNSTASNGVVVDAYISSSIAGTAAVGAVQSSGYYIIHVDGSAGDSVSFKVYGNNVSQAAKTWSAGFNHPGFNLTANTTANAQACPAYSGYVLPSAYNSNLGCSGGYCVHGYCRSSATYCGDGYCDTGESCSADDSACSSGYGCTNGCQLTSVTTSGGGGGGGGSVVSVSSNVGTTVSHSWGDIVAGSTSMMIVAKTDIPISELSFIVAKDLSGVSVGVSVLINAPNTSKVLSSKVYKYLQVDKAGMINDDLSSVGFNFKVAKSWLVENSVDSSNIVLSRYTTDWVELPTMKLSEDSLFVYFKATSSGMSYFAITTKAGTSVSSVTPPVVPVSEILPSEQGVVPAEVPLPPLTEEVVGEEITGAGVVESPKGSVTLGMSITFLVVIAGVLGVLGWYILAKRKK